MRTVDYLEDYLNGDDDTIHFESFHALRRHRKKLRATNDEDRKPSRMPKSRNHKASRSKKRSQDETKSALGTAISNAGQLLLDVESDEGVVGGLESTEGNQW